MEEVIMKIKQLGVRMLTLLFMIFCMQISLFATTGNSKLDAVLVMDASGSMKETDPNKLGLEGVKLFVDMLGATGNQVGLVTYGAQVNAIYPMTTVESQEDKEHIKGFVDGLTRDLEYTDITAGLGKAIEMQNNRDTSLGNKPLIILFTDGNNAVGGVAGRNNQIIDTDLAKMLDEAKSVGYPIYTIGLNDNGKLNETYLKNISDETGALAFSTKDPNELPDILTQIFAAHSNLKVQTLGTLQGTGDFEEVTIQIPNNNVLEANISATASGNIEFRLEDPSGNSKTIPSSDVTLHTSQSYYLLKLAKPVEGDWKLYVKGASGDQINIDLIYNYDIEVTVEPLQNTQFAKGDSVDINAYLSFQGNPIDDKGLYQSSKASLILKNVDSGKEETLDMQMDAQQFKGSCSLQEEGSYELSVLVEDTSYKRQSTPIVITVGKGGTQTNSSVAPVSPLDKTGDSEEGKLPLVWIGIALGVLGVLAIIIVVLKVVKESTRPLVGQMVVEIKDNTTGKLTPPQYKKLNVFKGKVSLHALLQFAPELAASEQIILKAMTGDKVMLINGSNYAIEKAGRIVKAETGIEVRKGDRFSINLADTGKTVQIEYLL